MQIKGGVAGVGLTTSRRGWPTACICCGTRNPAGITPGWPITTARWPNGDAAPRRRCVYVQEHEILPRSCSARPRRARETLERIRPALRAPVVRHEPDLYGASAQALLERLERVPDRVGSVMLIGHNPAIEELAQALAGPTPGSKFPTGALATLTVPCASWRDIGRDRAELVGFVRPRDLEA